MAFRTQYSSLGNLERAYRAIQDSYAGVRRAAVLARDRMNSPVNADDLMTFLRDTAAARVRVDNIVSQVNTADLLLHVQAVESDPTYDVVAEYTAMRSATIALVDAIWNAWIATSASVWERSANDIPTARILAAAGFTTVIAPNTQTIAALTDALIATIEAPA